MPKEHQTGLVCSPRDVIVTPKNIAPGVRFVQTTQTRPACCRAMAIQRAQDFFQEEAEEALEYYEWLRTLLAQEMTTEELEELASTAGPTQREIRSLMARDEQPGLQEPALLPRQGKSLSERRRAAEPLDVVKQMFREIDDANRGRPTWMKLNCGADVRIVQAQRDLVLRR